MLKTLEFIDDKLVLIDQRTLPLEEVYVDCTSHIDVACAIKNMVVRGAPAIGVSAAYGFLLGVLKFNDSINDNQYDSDIFRDYIIAVSNTLIDVRPTAVNLSWAVNMMKEYTFSLIGEGFSLDEIKSKLRDKAKEIELDDININKKIGENGLEIFKNYKNILTHCNAGSLATVAYGTALSVIRHRFWDKADIHVYVDETRPYLQGARLTSWELIKEDIPSTVICDNMAGFLMSKAKIDAIIVGADRIAANGDTANKIGTFTLGVLANYHKIPFFIAAPKSTIDIACFSGENIPIELRGDEEIKEIKGVKICSPKAKVYNPAFDITPSSLISGIITEHGVLYAPYSKSIKDLF